jgi:hypothetical protein
VFENLLQAIRARLVLCLFVCFALMRGGAPTPPATSITTSRWSSPNLYCGRYRLNHMSAKVLIEIVVYGASDLVQASLIADQVCWLSCAHRYPACSYLSSRRYRLRM